MPGKSCQTSFLQRDRGGRGMPQASKRTARLPRTLKMRYLPLQLGVIRGMSAKIVV